MLKTGDLIGEWIFAGALFPPDMLDDDGYVQAVLHGESPWHSSVPAHPKPIPQPALTQIIDVRKKAESFVTFCQKEVERHQPKIVGFTSSIQQHLASLSLARKLKSANPEVFTIMGGANVDGIMGVETVRQFEFIDAVLLGEGDMVFPQLVKQVLSGNLTVEGFQGIYTKNAIPQKLLLLPDRVTLSGSSTQY